MFFCLHRVTKGYHSSDKLIHDLRTGKEIRGVIAVIFKILARAASRVGYLEKPAEMDGETLIVN